MNLPINDIKQIIKNTIIAETQIIEIKIPETEKIALAMEIDIDIDNKLEAWEIMRNFFSNSTLSAHSYLLVRENRKLGK
ncbi:hypothetical protein MEN41_21205 [Dolichospermum sp. ST_con]|nr:hypothetical protein [Dolichospermum sp. ST_con]MDD1419115.1 hypothetical protein [Dolichospermum sp. ST_sed1]MDD1424842.1 hypothetical protein [Dolichospermum sp. ST_sed9]MDD1431366.1 hypothetical protein [Dolichospermum sp. ST_sed6]MDD1435378.1 hypothetical protein [Dolichospermum sp. ST_sed10]MDD1440779.1 hypothetical protein [Dolichospermum sp. ST_sed3]MDD1444585.1 hypothetical protein [Dolichospermum sp. ST_sed8]MDD1454894.1 hypothetical protein [Dolichospermum sp. ST_sed7]MDD145905